jgi:glycosyltransferase involved in cell wall biosynthesis
VRRIAFVSPLPPAPTGIADYSADVLGALAGRFEIEAFHGQADVDASRLPCPVHPADSLLARHRERPFALAVHQLGNGTAHAFQYDLLPRLPSLLVLHDLVLHHSRARTFLDAPEVRAYAAEPSSASRRDAARVPLAAYASELAHAYPAQAVRLEAVQLGTVGDLLPYAYPLFRLPVEAARATAVHNAFMADAVTAEVPDAEVVRVAMPMTPVSIAADRVRALRERLGVTPGGLLVGAFGLLTREKRIETLVRSFARVRSALPRVRLMLVGAVPDREALDAMLAARGLGDAIVTGRVALEELPVHIEAADVVVHLRYPTARETSAALLRVLAQGRPAIVSDLEHLAEIPNDAVVRADVADEEGEVTRALLRLAEQPALRERLGAAGRAFVASAHSLERCRDTYADAIERALAR